MVHNIVNVLNVTELHVYSKMVKMLNLTVCVFNYKKKKSRQSFHANFWQETGVQRAAVPAWLGAHRQRC